MNVQSGLSAGPVEPPEVAEHLARLRAWAATASDADLDAADPALRALVRRDDPALSTTYDPAFRGDAVYRASLPDLQNGPAATIRGAARRLQHVGISNFRLPVRHRARGGAPRLLETSVTGTVSLEADRKGINMSRIIRGFYDHADRAFDFDVIAAALDDYHGWMDATDARIAMRFALPLLQDSLRSGLQGYQYYDVTLELVDRGGTRLRIMHLDYVYSSTCPCSLELAEHARRARGQLATPHSQRSVARLSVVLEDGADYLPEDLIEACRDAVPTETQVMVKREDEQAFAELNAANPIFVEDAVRLFAQRLLDEPRVGDFRVVASHQESLHNHDAVSVLTEGPHFAGAGLDPALFRGLSRVG